MNAVPDTPQFRSSPSRRATWIPSLLVILLAAAPAPPAAAQSGGEASAARRLYHEAERLAQAGDVDAAVGEYRALVSSYPATQAAAEALLAIAELRFAQGRIDEAGPPARTLVDEYPQTEQAGEAQVLLARARLAEAESMETVAELLSELKRFPNLYPRESFPGLGARARALVLAGDLAMLSAQTDEAAGLYLDTIESEPVSHWTARARLGYARSLLLTADSDETSRTGAIQMLQSVLAEVGEGDDATATAARDLLTLAHRHWIRPAAGQPVWTEVRRVPGLDLRKPRGVAGGAGGRLVITDSSAAYVVGPEGLEATVPLSNASRPSLGADGEVYLTTRDGVRMHPSRASESFTYRGDKPRDLDRLEAAARGLFGRWLLLDRRLDSVAVLTREERTITTLPSTGDATDLAVGALGTIYVLTAKSSRVLVYGPDLQQIGAVSGSWQRPTALDVDALGNVYVFDRGSDTVSVHAPDGRKIATVGPVLPDGTALGSVEDIAVDASGRLALVDSKIPAVLILE